MYSLGRLTEELHQMLLDGYSTSDFARRHRLTPKQMDRLFTMIREEAVSSIPKPPNWISGPCTSVTSE